LKRNSVGGILFAAIVVSAAAQPAARIAGLLEPREGHRRTDAIGHLQIVATLPPGPCGDIVLALHQVSVVDTWKAGESRTREPVNP
jgi:hypothetical protein